MSNQLVEPIFQVYKLTFKSGRTYVGSHKQLKEVDNYITSSSYYLRHHNEDPLIKREILLKVKNQEQMDFLETWCILSDKAYNKDNVNYNLGNFFHRFSTAYHSEGEKRVAIEKWKKTMAAKSPEEKRSIVEKVKKTMAMKSPEELADIHRRQGVNSHGVPHKVEWWDKLTDEELHSVKNKMSDAKKKWFENASEEQLETFKSKCKQRELNRWASASKEERQQRCAGLLKDAEERKKKIKCIETGEVFDSLQDVRKWLGPKVRGCNISAQARGRISLPLCVSTSCH